MSYFKSPVEHSATDICKILRVHVTTGASFTRVCEGLVINGERMFNVRVTEQAEGGKANRAVIKILAKYVGIAPSRLHIIFGITSRNKVIKILS